MNNNESNFKHKDNSNDVFKRIKFENFVKKLEQEKFNLLKNYKDKNNINLKKIYKIHKGIEDILQIMKKKYKKNNKNINKHDQMFLIQ